MSSAIRIVICRGGDATTLSSLNDARAALQRQEPQTTDDKHSEEAATSDESTRNQIKLYINNVVCSYSAACHLNLRRIACEGMHVEYKKVRVNEIEKKETLPKS